MQVDGEEDHWQLEQPEDENGGGVGAVEERKQTPMRRRRFKQEIYPIDRPGEACAVSEAKGWEKVRARAGSGPIATVGPKEITKAFRMKENAMLKSAWDAWR